MIYDPDVTLTLFAHNAQERLREYGKHDNVQLVDGGFLDKDVRDKAMNGQDMVVLAYMPKKDPEA